MKPTKTERAALDSLLAKADTEVAKAAGAFTSASGDLHTAQVAFNIASQALADEKAHRETLAKLIAHGDEA